MGALTSRQLKYTSKRSVSWTEYPRLHTYCCQISHKSHRDVDKANEQEIHTAESQNIISHGTVLEKLMLRKFLVKYTPFL
jgi:hypothetical protein